MKVAFLGDVHGHIFHALAILATWQAINRQRLDLIVQIGDLGAFPDPARAVPNGRRQPVRDPAQHDFSRFLQMDEAGVERLRALRSSLLPPIHFIRGDFDDSGWLRRITKAQSGANRIDPYGLLSYIADGTILTFGELTIGCLGGIELFGEPTSEAGARAGIDELAYRRLMAKLPRTIDILVTHDLPFGVSVGERGLIQGSIKVLDLIETLQPRYHFAGHHRHLTGWRQYGRTLSIGLNGLVTDTPGETARCSYGQAGSLAVLDTETNCVTVVTDDWLCRFDQELDFTSCIDRLLRYAPLLR